MQYSNKLLAPFATLMNLISANSNWRIYTAVVVVAIKSSVALSGIGTCRLLKNIANTSLY